MDRSRRNAEWRVKQQLIDDDVSGLALRFDLLPTGEPILYIYGATLPHGNRLLRFSPAGELVHLATSVLGTEWPNWPHDAAPHASRCPAINLHQTFFTASRANNESPVVRD